MRYARLGYLRKSGRRWPEPATAVEIERVLAERAEEVRSQARSAAIAGGKSEGEANVIAGIAEAEWRASSGRDVEWRAALIADSGDAWVEQGMGWDLLVSSDADMAEEMTEAEFMQTYSHLTVPGWLVVRLRPPV